MKSTSASIYLLIICSLIFSCQSPKSSQEMPGTKPNIIWIVTEDQSPYWFPMYGDSTISLPNLESLAADGTVYTNAYTPAPVCAVARSGIITGMYPTTLGTHNMRSFNAYKPENESQIGVPSYSPVVPDGVRMFTEYLRAEGYYCANNAKEDYNFKTLPSAWDESSQDAHWSKRPDGAPFFYVQNLEMTHESRIWQHGTQELFVAPEDVPVPTYFPDDSVIRHDIAVNYSNLKRMDDRIGEILTELKKDGLYENSYIFFYGDHGGPFPRHKRALYETGTRVPLIIKKPGSNSGNERYNNELISFIDYAPTVLSIAGIEPPEVMQGLALLGEHKVPERDYLYTASDRFDGYYDRLRAVRSDRYKYIRNFNTDVSNALPVRYRRQMPMMQHMEQMYAAGELDSIQALWFQVPKPNEELYDLQKDPLELNNLADDTEYTEILMKHRELLDKWIESTDDLGRFNEKELMAQWLIDGKQPELSPPEIVESSEGIALRADQSDATIVWRSTDDAPWKIYTRALPKDQHFQAKTVRIGYDDSQTISF